MGFRGGIWWKRAPFVKLLAALSAGIILQWYFRFNLLTGWLLLLSGSIGLLSFFYIPFFNRFKYSYLSGVAVTAVLISLGALLTLQKDIRNHPGWIGHNYKEGDVLTAVTEEPLSERARSYKAEASLYHILHEGRSSTVKGRIIIYFRKDDSSAFPGSWLQQVTPGSYILFKKTLQEIKNSGNPGGFDYRSYSLFKGITHQAFLKPGEFEILPGKKKGWLKQHIFTSRERVLEILRKNIPGEKEAGLAEALLIGYKDDLDRSLVQSYTNTGVVHIIAISGLHLGLIYWLLALLLRPLRKSQNTKWLRPLLIISGLWAFCFLAGAQPSVLRAALMFSFIVLGESLSRKTSVYNSMAASAFLLLCINPFWIWDAGFQLSYAAVLSIIIFMRPVYNLVYCRNKLLDHIWKLNAVTLAAQVLTLPISIYHFHQFPMLFFLTNFLAVPLSSLILLAEILLCVISFFQPAALLLGKLIAWLIGWMNYYVQSVELIPGSLWDGLQITVWQAVLLILFITGISYWLMERSSKGLVFGLLALTGFAALRSVSFIQSKFRQAMIVYNIPQKSAIDLISGRKYVVAGDSELLSDEFIRHFHLLPSRTLHRMRPVPGMNGLIRDDHYIHYMGKSILLIDKYISFAPAAVKVPVDLLVISKAPNLNFKKLAASLSVRQVVFDASVPAWKARNWQKECDSLSIPWHDVAVKGAFVVNFR